MDLSIPTQIDTDVLVTGSGRAGLRVAIAAAKHGAKQARGIVDIMALNALERSVQKKAFRKQTSLVPGLDINTHYGQDTLLSNLLLSGV